MRCNLQRHKEIKEKMLFLFPSDYYDVKKIEADYIAEYETVRRIPGFSVILYNYDGFVSGAPLQIYPREGCTGRCVYRGWMLRPEQYKGLYDFLLDRGITLMNTPEAYNTCHLFPAARKFIEPFTPASLCFERGAVMDWERVNRTFKRFMIKDDVKSVKGMDFPSFFETPVTAADMEVRLSQFAAFRGDLFTGGIVLKEYVDFKFYNAIPNEYRAFFLKGRLLSLSRNSRQPESCPRAPLDFAGKFNGLPSQYYTVDFAELADGSWTVIETGDGQVSGLSPHQDVWDYYDKMRRILCEEDRCILG